MDWCRLHHGVSTDPKWRLIAKKAGVRAGDVLAVWTYMLDHASQAQPRGTLAGWDDEVCAIALDYEPEEICAIRDAMMGRVLADERLTGWERRQPKREDDGASDRKRAQRERDRARLTDEEAMSRDVTHCHAASRDVTTEQSREETSGITGSNEPFIPGAAEPAPSNVTKLETPEAAYWRTVREIDGSKGFGGLARQWLELNDGNAVRAMKTLLTAGTKQNAKTYLTGAINSHKQARASPGRGLVMRDGVLTTGAAI